MERPGNNRFNGARAGKVANHESRLGYMVVTIHRKHWMAHRIIWKLIYGEEPTEVDHISGRRNDNRLSNLRASDRQTNMRNLRTRKDNSSGHIGVNRTSDGTWRAYINEGGRFKNLRSEEHTSELQSLMRISYAVFCLKKKTQNKEQSIE